MHWNNKYKIGGIDLSNLKSSHASFVQYISHSKKFST